MKDFRKIPVQELDPPTIGVNNYQGLNPRTEVLPKGWNGYNSRPLPCEILVEHDFAFTVRDGCKLYADIFRPSQSDVKVPAIICWGPFGKKFNGLTSLKLMTPWNLGIPDGTLSGLEKFEAPDPADWVPEGYAIINIDSRGAGDSEGTMVIMGSQEAEDGYDTIEAAAKLDWCNGNVALAGNSHLAIVQWFIAALRPPSLKAIAPWEGCGDLYREQFARGGIYAGDLFDNLIVKYLLQGRHGMESFRKMFNQHPLGNDWWNDKRPDMKKINVPTYITGTWTNSMHGMGAIRGYLEVATNKKWLRWHPYQEWADLWGQQQGKDELLRFFNCYLKGEENDWEQTPHVRMAVLRYGESDPIENIVEDDFPLTRTEYRKLYFSPNNKLTTTIPAQAFSVQYNSESADFTAFRYTFSQKTRLIGMPKAIIYMSCPTHDDMDIYVCLRKISRTGEVMLNFNLPWSTVPVSKISDIEESQRSEVILYVGPIGILRASHREIDTEKSMHPNWPYHPHARELKVPLGDIVRLEIGIWAMGIEYDEGESIQVQISGRSPAIAGFGTFEHVKNTGEHFVHFGGEYDSHVILPFT